MSKTFSAEVSPEVVKDTAVAVVFTLAEKVGGGSYNA